MSQNTARPCISLGFFNDKNFHWEKELPILCELCANNIPEKCFMFEKVD